jgi:hypothetical protein
MNIEEISTAATACHVPLMLSAEPILEGWNVQTLPTDGLSHAFLRRPSEPVELPQPADQCGSNWCRAGPQPHLP